jgi:hypothetical protein
MPLLSTFAALSARGYGGGGSPIFSGGGWIGYQNTGTIFDNIIDSSGNNFYLIYISTTATALVKTDYLGSVQFFKSIPAYLVTVQLDSSGNIYLGGIQTGGGFGSGFAYLAKLNSSGSLTWARTLTGLGTGSVIRKIDIDGSSNIFAYCTFTSSTGGFTVVDSSGTGVSTVIYSQTGNDAVFKGFRNPSGNIWVLYGSGGTLGATISGTGIGITCRNSGGTTLFNYEPNTGLTNNNVIDFITDSSDSVYVAYTAVNTSTKISYLIITKVSVSGVEQWTVAKAYSYLGAIIPVINNPRLAIDNVGSLYISYSYSYSATNASFIDAISTSTGAQLFSNYFRVNGNAVTVKDLNFYSDQLIISTTSDIFNVPANGKIPLAGNYANGARIYAYYPTFDGGYTAVSVTTNAQTSGTSGGSFTTTTVTPTITDLGNTISVIVIGSGI